MLRIQERVRRLSDTDRQEYEQRADRFEAAIASMPEMEIESYLPDNGPLRPLLIVHLSKCEMEHKRQLGVERKVDDYLVRFPEIADDSGSILELLLWEYRLSSANGGSCDEFIQRYPNLEEEFRDAAQDLTPLTPWVPPPDYEVDEKPIGKGAWGVVYKANHKRLKRTEALKVVDPTLARSNTGRRIRAQIQFLRNEIPIAARLNHPNIVHLYADGESNGHPFFVMEYCPGGSLQDRLAKGCLAANEAASLVRILALAADVIHAFGLIHRDLKPSNVLFGEGDVPKIADFGLTLSISPGKAYAELREIAGTPAYMAPEQADPSRGDIGPATDVYGLGAILHASLTGRPPGLKFVRSSHSQGPTLHRSFREGAKKIPLDLGAICAKCLNEDSKARYQTARELAEDLARFLAGEPVQARRQPIRFAWWWVRKNRWPVLAVFVFILLSAAYAGFRAQEDQRELSLANERTEKAKQFAAVEQQKREAEYKRAESERRGAHAALVASVGQRGRVGDWKSALPDYDRAILDGEADSEKLRVERLVGYLALNDTAAFAAELDSLEKLELGEMEAQVKLMRAVWLLCDDKYQAEGRQLAREALKSRHCLSNADAAFAEALAAESVGQSVAGLRKAIEYDPLHYLAGSSLAVALALVGDLEEARKHTSFLRGIFPFSPAPDIAEATIAVIELDRTSMQDHIRRAGEKLRPDRRSGLDNAEKSLLLLTELLAINNRMNAAESNWAPLLEIGNAGLALGKLQAQGVMPSREPLGLPIPSVSLFYRRYSQILSLQVEIILNSLIFQTVNEKLLLRLRKLNDDYPDAVLLHMEGVSRLMVSGKSSDAQTRQNSLKEVSRLAWQAVRVPNLLPKSPIQYQSRCLGIISDLIAAMMFPDADANIERIRANLNELVIQGRSWPRFRQEFVGHYIQIMATQITREQCGVWKIDEPPGKAMFEKRRRDLMVLARFLLDNWEMSEPNNREISRLRGELDALSKSSGVVGESRELPP